MKKILRSFFIFLVLLSGCAFAVEEKLTVRVGISNTSFSGWEHKSAVFISDGVLNVIDMSNGNNPAKIPFGVPVEVNISNGLYNVMVEGKTLIEKAKGPIVLTSDNKIGIKNLVRKGSPAYYRGMFELKTVNPNAFNIVNVLDMQSYLKGVVPNEMPVSFGFEALKAQSVAARNYANRSNNAYKNYDVCDSTACQVYYGANGQTALSDRAVDETEGIYALYGGDIILTLYSSTASGITEDYINTFGNFVEDKPYLKSVKDNYNMHGTKTEDEILQYFENPLPSFDMNSPRGKWEQTFNRFELEEILSGTLREQSKAGNVFPAFSPNDELYGLEDIKVLKRGASYKALEIQIKAVSGDYTVKKELPIRKLFKKNGSFLYSANFGVVKNYKDEKEDSKHGALFKKEPEKETETPSGSKRIYRTRLGKKLPFEFKLVGAGFGHGVGMSQYGAGYLASYGVDFEGILKHYYTGITLGTIPKTVSYNNLGINYTQKFFYSSKKNRGGNYNNPSKSPLRRELNDILDNSKVNNCYLVIEDNNRVSSLNFEINGASFSPDMTAFRKKNLKTDITKFLKNGQNTIVFKPLSEKDKKKTVRFYVTLEESDGSRRQ